MSRGRIILHPRPGRRLPPELQPRAVLERTERLAGGVLDPELPALLSRIDDGGPIHQDNRVTVYTRGEDAFAAMRAAIDQARYEILLESYIMRDDETGRFVEEALEAASARGVRVCVLADAWGSLGTGGRLWRRLAAAGVEARFYHSLFRQPWYQPYRDHRKILTADRRVAFTGGMNVGAEYGLPRRSKKRQSKKPRSPNERPAVATWRDTHCRVEGSTASEMAAVFGESWERAGGELGELESDLPLQPSAVGNARALVLESRPGRGAEESSSVLAALAGAARHRFWLTNAYFAPRRRAIDVLCRTAGRGVDVRLLLPGVTDVPPVRHAGHGWFRTLLAGGVRIWEYRPSVLHAKSLVVDGQVSVIGSSNMDFRSFRFNSECNLVIFDPDTGAVLNRTFEDDLRQADEIEAASWRQRGRLHRVGDRMARWLAPWL